MKLGSDGIGRILVVVVVAAVVTAAAAVAVEAAAAAVKESMLTLARSEGRLATLLFPQAALPWADSRERCPH